MLLSYNTWSMPSVPLARAVEHCASLGFDSMELTICPGWPTDASLLDAEARRRVRRMFDESGLALSGFTGNTAVVDEDSWATNRATLQRYLDFAAELQHPGEVLAVSTTSGGYRNQERTLTWDVAKSVLVDRFGELADYAAKGGTCIAIEPHVMAVLRRPEHARWLVEQVESASLRVNLDISHMDVQGISPEEAVSCLASHIVGTEVKDQRGTYPDFDFLIPGEGTFDYIRFLNTLKEAGYSGSVSVEVAKARQARQGYDALEAATKAYAVLAKAFRDAGVSRPPR